MHMINVVHEEILDVDTKAMLVCSVVSVSHNNITAGVHNLHVVYITKFGAMEVCSDRSFKHVGFCRFSHRLKEGAENLISSQKSIDTLTGQQPTTIQA